MNGIQKKLFAGGAVVVIAIGYLALTGAKKGWVYYLPVDQYLSQQEYKTQRVKLHGKVAAEGLISNPGALDARFILLGDTGKLSVHYSGIIPDLFKADHEVVVEGKLDGAGVFQADVLLTKCASKYMAGEKTGEKTGEKSGEKADEHPTTRSGS